MTVTSQKKKMTLTVLYQLLLKAEQVISKKKN
jgi:hypothetical protein